MRHDHDVARVTINNIHTLRNNNDNPCLIYIPISAHRSITETDDK